MHKCKSWQPLIRHPVSEIWLDSSQAREWTLSLGRTNRKGTTNCKQNSYVGIHIFLSRYYTLYYSFSCKMGVHQKYCHSFNSEGREDGVGKSCCRNCSFLLNYEDRHASPKQMEPRQTFRLQPCCLRCILNPKSWISLEFSLEAKCNAPFIKKTSASLKLWYTIPSM